MLHTLPSSHLGVIAKSALSFRPLARFHVKHETVHQSRHSLMHWENDGAPGPLHVSVPWRHALPEMSYEL